MLMIKTTLMLTMDSDGANFIWIYEIIDERNIDIERNINY